MRVSTILGVAQARSYTYVTLQREYHGRDLRFAAIGLTWPMDKGETLRLVAGRPISQAQGEAIADISLSLSIGDLLPLANETYLIVGLTQGFRTTGGDPALFITISDSSLIARQLPPAAAMLERERALSRLR